MNGFLQLLWTQAWQIAVLALVVAIVTRIVAKNRPHLAHAMWLLVLIKCLTPPIWGHSLGLFSRLQAAISTEQSPAASDATLENIPQVAIPTSSLVTPSLEPELYIAGNAASDLTTTRELPTTESPRATVPAIDLSEVATTKSVEGVRGPSHSWPAILLFCVAAGAFVTLSLMIVRCVQCLRSIHRHRTTEFDDLLMERVQDLSHKLRLRRAPRVIVSDVLFGPAVLGFLKHTIVLPRCLLQSSRSCLPERTFAEGEPARRTMDNTGLPEDTECTQVAASREVLPGRQDLQFLDPILAHELLHIRRGDLRTGTLQAIVQSLWWFHPAVWLSNRWLSREAERCCDEQVIAELGCSPAQYARSLLSVIESKHQLQPVPVFPGMKPVEITTQRMERIMSLKSNLKKQTPLWCWLAVAALAILVLPGAIAKPQSEENVVEAQPQEMSLPQETKVVDVAEVEVSTKTYIVGDLVECLAKEQNLSLDQARKSLLQIFESSVVPVHRHLQGAPAPPVTRQQPSPPADASPRVISIAGAVSFSFTEITELSSYAIDGDRMVVVQSAAGHETLLQYIDAVRQYGFTTFQVTARYIIGPPEEINSLMESLQQEKPFPKAAEGETVAKSSQSEKQAPKSAATLCVGTTGIVSFEESRKIEELARSKADCLSIQCPTVRAINGQVATIQVGETKPFIVGFKENDEPMIRTVVEGLTLRVTPTVVDKGLFSLQSVACLEGTSEQRLITTTGRVTETPKMFTLPAITTKQVQTTVELQENQALLQSGMITTEEGKSRAFLAVLEAQLIAPEVAVDGEGTGETPRASAGNPCKSLADLKGMIRLNDAFIVSPDFEFTSDTVLAFVADREVTVGGAFFLVTSQLDYAGFTPSKRRAFLRNYIEQRLPAYLYNQLVFREFEIAVPFAKQIAIRDSYEGQFNAMTEIQKEGLWTKDEHHFNHILAAKRTSRELLRDAFMRQVIQTEYEMSLPKESPLRDRTAIESHCRQLMFEARLRRDVSLRFHDMDLTDVLRSVATEYGVNIALATRQVAGPGGEISPNQLKVTYQCENQPLGEALATMLEPLGLRFTLEHETVKIGIAKVSGAANPSANLLSLPYSVADLVEPVPQTPLAKNNATTAVPGRSLTDSVRIDDDFVISPDMPISGSTVIAYVNDRPITVEAFDGYMWNKLVATHALKDSVKRLTVLESIASSLPGFVYHEMVLQHISSNPADEAIDKLQNHDESTGQGSAEIQLAVARKSHEVCQNVFADYVANPWMGPADSRKEARHLASLLKSGRLLNDQPEIQKVNAYVQAQRDQSIATHKPAVIRHVQELVTKARLRNVVSLDFKNTPLHETMISLSKALGISIDVNSLHFQIGARTFDKPGTITFRCHNQSLSEVINSVFQPYGMKLHLNGESVVLAFTDSQMCMDRFQSLPGPPAYGIFGDGVNDGWKVLEKEVRLLDAIVQFGGIPPADDATISITNPETVAGKAIPVSMSLRVLQKNSSGKLNRILRDGDIVTVSRKDSVNVRPGRTARAASEEEAVKDPEQLRSGSASVEGQSRDPVGAKRVPSLPEKSEFSDVAEKWFKDDAWVQNANGRFKHDGILLFFNQHEVVGDGHSIRIKPLAMICPQEKDGAPVTVTADSALLETSTIVSGESGHLAKIVSGTLEGNVRITSSDGTRIEGQKFQISEDAMNVSTFEPVTLIWEKKTGEAEGGAVISLRPSTDTAGIKLTDGHRVRNIRLHGPATITDQSTFDDGVKREKRLELRCYSVADLITRSTSAAELSAVGRDGGTTPSTPNLISSVGTETDLNTMRAKLDFSPLVELIKASIEPESWDTGGGAVAEHRESISLVIRQTPTGHEAIARLLSQLRKSYDSVQINCRLMKLTADSQLKGLEDKCSLHSLSDDQRWALLTKTRSEALQKFLADEKAEVLSCPTIVTISGQPALVQVATADGAALTGFQLSANPHLIADSSVIRLSHSVTVGELAKDAQAAVHESLVGSGQTLLLVIEQPGKVDGRPDRFVVMLTPEHVKEEEETQSGLKE